MKSIGWFFFLISFSLSFDLLIFPCHANQLQRNINVDILRSFFGIQMPNVSNTVNAVSVILKAFNTQWFWFVLHWFWLIDDWMSYCVIKRLDLIYTILDINFYSHQKLVLTRERRKNNQFWAIWSHNNNKKNHNDEIILLKSMSIVDKNVPMILRK